MCDWILEEEKIDELKKVLLKTKQLTRNDLCDLFFRGAADNTANLTTVRVLIKRLQEYEKYFISLETSIPIEKCAAANCLEELEKQPAHVSVADYTAAISKTESLLGDVIRYPTVMDCCLLFKSENSAVLQTDLTKSAEGTAKDVCIKLFQFCSFFL